MSRLPARGDSAEIVKSADYKELLSSLKQRILGAEFRARRNLFYMRRFAALWPEPEMVQTLSAQIGWSNFDFLDLAEQSHCSGCARRSTCATIQQVTTEVTT